MNGPSQRILALFLGALFFGALLAGLLSIGTGSVQAHLTEDRGESGQLYSYFITGSDRPVIDGFFNSAAGGANKEWSQAYVREIRMVNTAGTREIFATVFVMNDAEYLYLGISYVYENSGNNDNFVEIFFDEGNGSTNYDGDHDDQLTGASSAPNENAVKCKKDTTTALTDMCWDGSSWITDGDASTDFEAEVEGDIVSTQLKYEFKIPLDDKEDSSTSSDLNVGPADEVGILFHARLQGQGVSYTDYYWSMTNLNSTNANNINDPPGWGDLKLGVRQSDHTLYSTYAVNGAPKVDGDISNDFSWADCYERDMVFTNFNGSKLNIKLMLCEDPDNTCVYIGLVVYDSKSSAYDAAMVHFEQDYTSLPSSGRDYLMDSGKENKLMYSQAQGFTDRKFTASGGITDWQLDTTDPTDEEQDGSGSYYLNPSRYEFEFCMNYSAADDGMNTEDLYLSANAIAGIQIQYYDADQTICPNYWWEYNGNLNTTLIDKNSNTFLSMGYSYLQLGGPSIKLISPQDGGTVTGSTYNFQILAVDENAAGIKWCGFQVVGSSTWTSLIKQTTTNIWYTTWDTTALSNGAKQLVIIAKDDESIAVRRYIDVTVYNAGTGIPPVLSSFDLDPTESEPISGTSVKFTATSTSADGIKLYIDNTLTGDITESFDNNYECTIDSEQLCDGVHQFRAVAYNTYGESARSVSIQVDNWQLSSNAIDDPGTELAGTHTFKVRPVPSEDAWYSMFYIDDLLMGSDHTISAGSHDFTINTTMLEDGVHVAKAVTYDPDSVSLISFKVFTVNNWNPAIAITAPTDGAVVSGDLPVQLSTVDLAGAELFLDSSLIKTFGSTGPYSFDLNTTSISDGSHTLKVVGEGIDGGMVSDTVGFVVRNDNTDPIVALVSPMEGQVVYSDLDIRVSVTDASEILSVTVSIDGGDEIPLSPASRSTLWEGWIPISTLSVGGHIITAAALDTSGNSGTSETLAFENGLEDLDGDGKPDERDEDLDGDGVLNTEDEFPYNTTEWMDTDGDGIGNNADTDDDNDGWPDTTESTEGADPLNSGSQPLDTDKDGIPDSSDDDDDGDGFTDDVDLFPIDPNEWSDLDGDGIGDNSDLDMDGDEVPNSVDRFPMNAGESTDLDLDGIGDNSDTDRDGDGYPNTNDSFPDNSGEWSDLDLDGIGDNSDADRDGDGRMNDNDLFPLDILEWSDSDGDGIGDNEDTDDDNDGFSDATEALYSSDPFNPASAPPDQDGDGTPDAVDDDRDGDGVLNDADAFPADPKETKDLDGDGVGDNADTDKDGDGVPDVNDAFPYDPAESLDTDGDGVGNNADSDDDNDGVKDGDDEAPLNPEIGPKDYSFLVLPITLAVLTILLIVGMFFISKKNQVGEQAVEQTPPSRARMQTQEKKPEVVESSLEDNDVPEPGPPPEMEDLLNEES